MRYSLLLQNVALWMAGLSWATSNLMAADPIPGRRLAVVVGVNMYRANTGLDPLQHAVKDANRLSAVLRKAGFTVFEMTHDVAREPGKEVFAPNLEYIRDQINGILDTPNLGDNDTVLITLHGHGVHFDLVEKVTRNGKEIEQKTAKFYFCPADATLQAIEIAQDVKEKHHLLSLDELYTSLGACPAATKLLIVDACRNDPTVSKVFREGEMRSKTMPKLAPPPGGMAAFLSCRESQLAVEDKELGQGVFTHFLIQGLEGKADQPLEGRPADGIVTLAELTSYTANNTYAYVRDKHNGRKQSPEIKGEFDANTPLVRLALLAPGLLIAPFDSDQARAGQDAWAKHLNVVRTTTSPSGVELVLIPPGEYLRGSSDADVAAALKADSDARAEHFKSEQPQHRVRITKPYYMAKFETTQEQLQKVLGRNPAYFSATGDGKEKVSGLNTAQFPAENVTWLDCLEFCNKLSELEGKALCYDLSEMERNEDRSIKKATVRIMNENGYRLPTEAEWEYSCRAGTTTAFHFGDELNGIQANVNGNYPYGTTKGPYLDRLTMVGSFDANRFGLYDLCGNVFEWCQDGYDESAYKSYSGKVATDPFVDTNVQYPVIRGGCWKFGGTGSRSAYRGAGFLNYRGDGLGFRVVCFCGPRT